MVNKYIVLSFYDANEALKFVEYLRKSISNTNLDLVVRGNKVKITIHGTKGDIEDILQRIKERVSDWRRSRQRVKGLYTIPVSFALSMASLKISIPFKAFIDALNLQGYKSTLKGNIVYTEIEAERLIKELERFSEHYSKVIYLDAYPIVKRLIAIVMFVESLEIEESIELLKNLGLIDYNEEEKLRLKTSYEEALKVLRRVSE